MESSLRDDGPDLWERKSRPGMLVPVVEELEVQKIEMDS